MKLDGISLNMLEINRKLDRIMLDKEDIAKSAVKCAVPPSRPPIFFGRDDLVETIAGHLLTSDQRHVVLCGAGGIGKSSLAKAVINEPRIVSAFGPLRLFVRFDDMQVSQVSHSGFVERIAQELGVCTSNNTSLRNVCEFFTTNRVLLVIDNAETLQEAGGSASLIDQSISDFGAYSLVTIMITSRNRRHPANLRCHTFDIQPLDPQSARDAFLAIYGVGAQPDTAVLDHLLSSVDHHPLSINLLANAAEENQWGLSELKREWESQHTKVLDVGEGKADNLAITLELSLCAPSVTNLGEDVARSIVGIIAFFPQGVPRDRVANVFPSVSSIRKVIDTLCRHSLLLRRGDFITMLAPVRLYAVHELTRPQGRIFSDVRVYYYKELLHNVKALINNEDLNIESLVAFDLSLLKDPNAQVRLSEVLRHTSAFIWGLAYHNPRSTIIQPMVLAFPEFRWPSRGPRAGPVLHIRNKLLCLRDLADLAYIRHDTSCSLELYTMTRDLGFAFDQPGIAMRALMWLAGAVRRQGLFCDAKQEIERAMTSNAWIHAGANEWGTAALMLGFIKFYTTIAPSDGLFGDAYESYRASFDTGNAHISASWRCTARAYMDADLEGARAELQSCLSRLTSRDEAQGYQGTYFFQLAKVAALEGNFDETQDFLRQTRSAHLKGGKTSHATLALVNQAAIASNQGDFDKSETLLQEAEKERGNRQPLADYVQARNKLFAGRLDEAKALYEELRTTAVLGEIGVMENRAGDAEECFADAASLCEKMGMAPALLFKRSVFSALDNRFHEWDSYLDQTVEKIPDSTV
ncbi:hypothetical protein F5I97DRAFT_287077 [Phlebopus sp. FC_14]|nr:hypothetical protein F5I97DRAFT_287077 [Phlebopus sp. FC_14]